MCPRSRTLIAAVAVALLVTSGCLATPGTPTTGDGSPSATSAGDTSATAASTSLPGTSIDWPDGPKERPERPTALNESSVGSFARTYEYRYVYNSLWYDETSEVSAECELDAVERRGDAWRAVVTCTAYSNTGGESTADGTATSTVVHADWFTQTYVYWIDGESVHRERAEGGRTEG
ncbi:hypothetical protein [Halobaculum rubrum]|uniref:hypothetical protein n=1 Tax=Halobaculum rubrum TaxID=2872158 RepID=UPI001CA3C755|nr:hypothetical protein [Halobaculum rubrum]QZX98574.1 hypothetical protein K6T25_09810 [Halobaculum rubrum]